MQAFDRAMAVFDRRSVAIIMLIGVIAAGTLAMGVAIFTWRPPLWLFDGFFAAYAVSLGSALWLSWRRGTRRIAQAAEDPGEVLRERISHVNAAFAAAAVLMDDLRRDLEAQQAAREALVSHAEEQQRLLEVNEDQAERIRQILVGETKATIRAERRQQWMFFALGVVVSIPIGVMINLLVP